MSKRTSAASQVREKFAIPVLVAVVAALIVILISKNISYFDSDSTAGKKEIALESGDSCEARDYGKFATTECCSILDNRTGMEWFVGEDRKYSWSDAHTWAGTLPSCGGGWRLPSASEVDGIFDPDKEAGVGFLAQGSKYPDGHYFKAHLDPVFYEIGRGAWVWLNEEPQIGQAKSYNLNQGVVVTYHANSSEYETRAFAVRQSR